MVTSTFKTIALFSSLSLLVYFYIQAGRKYFFFVINDDIALSHYFSFLCKPPFLHLGFIFTFCIILCALLFQGIYIRYLGWFCSIIILNLAWYLTFDLLALKNVTTYFFIKVYHPIPVEVKAIYLESHINFMCNSLKLPAAAEPILESIISSPTFKNTILIMDAAEIQQYARRVVYETANTFFNEKTNDVFFSIISRNLIAVTTLCFALNLAKNFVCAYIIRHYIPFVPYA